jgi:hypothetical protein
MGTTKTAPTPLPYPHKNVEKPWAKYQTSRRCPRHLYNSLVAAATSPPPHPAITTTSTAMTTSTSLHHHHRVKTTIGKQQTGSFTNTINYRKNMCPGVNM